MATTADTLNDRVVAWLVPLIGHEFDLEDLPHWLNGRDVHAVKRDDGYYLVIPASLAGVATKQVRAIAASHLELINGAGRLLNTSYRELAIDDKFFGIDTDGHIVSTVLAVGAAEYRTKAGAATVVVNGIAQADPRTGAADPLLRAASLSTRASDALIIVGRSNLTWSELYLVFELVESECGSRMFDLGWIKRSDANLLSRTANSYSVLRSRGRHGKDRNDPPSAPMALRNAGDLIRALVCSWLRDLSEHPDGASRDESKSRGRHRARA
ncbi:hypothetical protein [Rivibacter subsaxonicus]|uniref:Uncharacterized protein n=1 Tax=Rivibacter subsaxonicus TaxID=457575 RepID=A0A4Q7W1N3_9BURK|nr:hypothetical protein [Rivibacter subsaxonicus]RZU03060.1 hypothetical protein EV670_1093 [Rivibacter subsaxonicus]